MTNSNSLKFRLVNELKNSLRYVEELPDGRLAMTPKDPAATVGNLYLRKAAFKEGKFPPTLVLQVP